MAKRKIAVALSDWLVEELDTAADEQLTSRSALVEEAVAAYVVSARSERDRRDYVEQAEAAVADMRDIAREHGDARAADEPSSLELLRALRSGRDGAR